MEEPRLVTEQKRDAYTASFSRKVYEDDTSVYELWNEMGDAQMVVHEVFQGIKLIYNSVHTNRCELGIGLSGNMIEIHHCREGRMEQPFEDEFFYLMPGDLSVTIRKEISNAYNFPLHHYHGITIVIDMDIAPQCFSCFLQDVNVQPMKVAKKLCGDKSSFVIRSQDYIEHIFSELYAVPESYKKGYFKIKIMELLLVLSGIDPNKSNVMTLSKTQAILAQRVASYLSSNIDRHITVSDLSEKFHVSPSHLQNVFKGVYGVPVYSYMRIQKMQLAGMKLINTELSVLEIANEFGYNNASKFASAFREIMGEAPVDYRKMHSPVSKERLKA